jgi:hypothetical protein
MTICTRFAERLLKCEHVVTIDKAVNGVKESSKAIELLTKLKDTSVKLNEILKTRKDNVSRFEEETLDIVFPILLTNKPQTCPSSYQQCLLSLIIQ